MQTHSLPSNQDELNDLLTETVTAAIEGNLTDTQRVVLYQVAMAVTANELHRIERAAGGTVSAESYPPAHRSHLRLQPRGRHR